MIGQISAFGLSVVSLSFLLTILMPSPRVSGENSFQRGAGAFAAEPRRDQSLHPAIADPANIAPSRAEEIYQAIRGRLQGYYAQSGDPLFLAYQTWKRFTKLPYRSPDHGERFVNHYANAVAEKYGDYEKAGPLPVGSIVIKDSFAVTAQGQVMSGPLFMMEKMPKGFPSLAGTWRFMMLRQDGSVVGLTGGVNTQAVRFCAECHSKAGADQDFLYFMPDEARLN